MPPQRRAAAAVPGMVEQLTARELEILALLAAGTPNPRIAEELVVTLEHREKARDQSWASSGRQPHRGRHAGPAARPDPRHCTPAGPGAPSGRARRAAILPGQPLG